jgi:hypothetical protein
MLKQVYQSDAYPYIEQADPFGFGDNIPPWGQNNWHIMGMFSQPTPPAQLTPATVAGTVTVPLMSIDTIYLIVYFNDVRSLIHESFSTFKFNSVTGSYLGRQDHFPGAFFAGSMAISENGGVFLNFGSSLQKTDPENIGGSYSETINASDFGFSNFSTIAQLSENGDALINPNGGQIDVYRLSTKQYQYSLQMAENIVACCMVSQTQCYVLCANSILLLVDFARGVILNAFYLPSSGGGDWSAAGAQWLYWYPTYSQLFVCELVANNVDGSNATTIKGYKMVPTAQRLTVPIPLQSPLVGDTVQVMTQLVDDLCRGIGGTQVQFTATGGAGEVLQATTDLTGKALVKLDLTATGSTAINCTATVP